MFELYKNAAATVPSAGTDKVRLFVDTDGLPYVKDAAGTVTPLKGDTGATGATGATGPGVAAGGTTGQVLAKASATNYDTTWVNPTGAVDSVNGQTGVVVLDAADVGAEPADATILKDADIGVTVQGYSSVLAGTTASFTTADETKLDGIAAGAEVNVNADWNATSGDAQILNKPTLYSDASVDTHLNTGTAGTGEVLSWNGTDYDWITASTGSVTSVTGTSPVNSSGGATPAISLASGYGDTQNPYASKTANNFLAAPNGASGAPTFRAVVAADIPTLNQNTTGTASNVTGTVAFANGGTGETTRQAAMDALAGATTSGQYLRGNGTDVVMAAIQAGDVPTLNQNTTGTASNVTGIVAVANGGSGTATPSLVAGTNVTISGAWPNQTIAASGGGGGSTIVISNKTAAYTVVAGDLASIINCTANTFTVALTAAATLGAGFNVTIWNTGTGVVTINPDGTETVDGVDPTTEFKISQGTGVDLVCTGTAWLTGSTRNSGSASIGVLGVQLGRNSAGNMAIATTGHGAVSLGGSYASGADSFAAAVGDNTATYGAQGGNSIAMGYLAKTTSSSSIALSAGGSATAGGNGAVAIGGRSFGTTASGPGSFALGDDLLSSGTYSFSLGFRSSSTLYGKFAYASGQFAARADAQTGTAVLRRATTDATATVLSSDGSTPGTTNQVILANNSAMTVTGTVICRQSVAGSDKASGWTFTAVIRRGANAASTTLVSSVTPILVAQDLSLATTVLAITADTTNGGLAVTVTGIAATNLRWVATVQTTEVTYA